MYDIHGHFSMFTLFLLSGQLQWTNIDAAAIDWRFRVLRLPRQRFSSRPMGADVLCRCIYYIILLYNYREDGQTVQPSTWRDIWMWQKGWLRMESHHWTGLIDLNLCTKMNSKLAVIFSLYYLFKERKTSILSYSPRQMWFGMRPIFLQPPKHQNS